MIKSSWRTNTGHQPRNGRSKENARVVETITRFFFHPFQSLKRLARLVFNAKTFVACYMLANIKTKGYSCSLFSSSMDVFHDRWPLGTKSKICQLNDEDKNNRTNVNYPNYWACLLQLNVSIQIGATYWQVLRCCAVALSQVMFPLLNWLPLGSGKEQKQLLSFISSVKRIIAIQSR